MFASLTIGGRTEHVSYSPLSFFFADKAKDFIGKGHPGGEEQGKGTHENCSLLFVFFFFFFNFLNLFLLC